MSLRGQITTAALLGTAQQPFEPAATGTALDEFVVRIQDANAAQRFLNTLALVVSYEQAGAKPVAAPRLLPQATPDPRPRCSPVAAAHLRVLLEDRQELLKEWFSLADEAGQRPPEELAPALLDAASATPSLRTAVRHACGELAEWLAPFRTEWSWVTATGPEESIWDTGSLDERLAYLARLRLAEPARAIDLLRSCWTAEPADTRRQFVEVLATGRSLADEEFLESVLDDRSAAVRRAASEHLSSLAGSKLIERMKTRLDGRIRISRTGLLLRKTALEVEPIDSLDAAMMRDGIDKEAPQGSGLGDRAWWTTQAIAAIPPDYWCEQFHLTAAELFEAAHNGQWQELLLEGWRTAAVRHRTLPWLQALADDSETVPGVSSILRAMPDAERERAMLRLLRGNADQWLPTVADCCPHAWSIAFTEAVVEIVSKRAAQEGAPQFRYMLRMLLRAAGRLANPLARWPEESDVFAEFTDVVGFRREMRNALLPPRK